MFRIEMYHLRRKVHFVIMTSVFDSPVKINTIYDLKGSLIGREATAKDRESGGVLKDMDLLHDHRKIHLGPKKAAFLWQLRRDCDFLARNYIMDYSLLVGIHDRSLRESVVQEATQSETGVGHRTPTASRPHSNTPFRRSLHMDATAAQALANSLATHRYSEDNGVRSHLASNADATPVKGEHKDMHEHKDGNEISPSASLDEHSVMSGMDARDVRAHMPSPSKDGSVAGARIGSDDEYDEAESSDDEDEEFEDVDEGDSVEGSGMKVKSLGQQQFAAISDAEGHTYGNGIAYVTPWTSRADGGINSRIGTTRGNEIYFVGVIDILQEYNTSKRAETMIKVRCMLLLSIFRGYAHHCFSICGIGSHQ